MRCLEERGLGSYMIVFTSDHGDYPSTMVGEKDLFHERPPNPLLVIDPRRRPTPRASRLVMRSRKRSIWRRSSAYFGGRIPYHVLEGLSLMPLLRGESRATAQARVLDLDYRCRTCG